MSDSDEDSIGISQALEPRHVDVEAAANDSLPERASESDDDEWLAAPRVQFDADDLNVPELALVCAAEAAPVEPVIASSVSLLVEGPRDARVDERREEGRPQARRMLTECWALSKARQE
eukprot:3831109-Pyramimonas_sp.AAC.1